MNSQRLTIPVFLPKVNSSRFVITGVRYTVELQFSDDTRDTYVGYFSGVKQSIHVDDKIWLYFLIGEYKNEIGIDSENITNLEVI